MENYTAPARTLTPDQHEAIRYFYSVRRDVWTFLSVFIPVMLCWPVGAANGSFAGGIGAGLVVAGLINALRYYQARRKMTRAAFIYEYGHPETVLFTGLGANYNIRVNGQPQPVIELLRGSESLRIKTFDRRIIEAFSQPQQVVYVHPDYPDVLVPSGLFALGRGSRPSASRPRNVGV